jgi:23S rRNA (cytidine1920-2'-O)/16S rRNA (cytidine1409-2'-O)-methyltransferase
MAIQVKKKRIDQLLVDRGYFDSRNLAQRYIMSGRVKVHNVVVTKPSFEVNVDASIEVDIAKHYVSRGAYKLMGALDHFGIDVRGLVCADIGASTGGFTQVLIERGAARVYAYDVGKNLLAQELRKDKRVILMEGVNVRYLEAFPERIEFITVDVSFISLRLIIPSLERAASGSKILLLFKPQFEVGRDQVGKGGIVRDEEVRQKSLASFIGWLKDRGHVVVGEVPSAIKGSDGNQEYFIYGILA